MFAVVITNPGNPDVLQLRQVAEPVVHAAHVRVRVRAAGVNRADLLQRAGLYPPPPGAPVDIPGLEVAGEVDAVGLGVTEWKEGDRVFGVVSGGGYAEYVAVHSRTVCAIPGGMSFEEAAAIPEAFVTAYDALLQGSFSPGETVLIHAVGSGVGNAATQVVRALGGRVLGTARSQFKLDQAAAFGLQHGVVPDAGPPLRFAEKMRAFGSVDVVVDLVGGGYVAESLEALSNRGRLVAVGLLGGSRADIDLGLLLRKRLRIVGTVLRSRPLEEKIVAAQQLAHNLCPLFSEAKLRPVVAQTFPLAEAAAAHTAMEGGALFGKIVLTC